MEANKATLSSLGKSSNKLKQRFLSLDVSEFVLGRSREANCMILDVNVSRRHASFKFDSNGSFWTVTDNKVGQFSPIKRSKFGAKNCSYFFCRAPMECL